MTSEFKKVSHSEWLGSDSDDDDQTAITQAFNNTSKKLKTNEDHGQTQVNAGDSNEQNANAISEVNYAEALKIRKRYKEEGKRLSLKQKTLYKKTKKLIAEYEKQLQLDEDKDAGDSDAARFDADRSIFDTKKGQVLFELQKQYKGDSRFKLDSRFAEDIEVEKLPVSMKQLTTGIDFNNLSDGSDHDQKKSSNQQKKDKKAKKSKVATAADDEEGAEAREIAQESESEQFTKWISSDEEDVKSELPEDYIDQEELEEGEDLTLEEEQNQQLHVLQEIMPDQKLFLQNKKKNLKIVNNQFAGYGAMLSAQESSAVLAQQKKKKSRKERKAKKEGDSDENSGVDEKEEKNKVEEKSDEDESTGKVKKEKSFNLVIPRFDPSQLIVKQVMKTQEKEREEKIKEKENKKKAKKLTVEAKIEAGIDKKMQKIMQANSILDKNLGEHKKLEGVVEVKKKKPMLKKIAIDANKWRDIIQSSMAESAKAEADEKKEANEGNTSADAVDSQKKKGAVSITVNKAREDPTKKPQQQSQQAPPVKFQQNLSLLFATVPTTATIDPSRAQFKLFG